MDIIKIAPLDCITNKADVYTEVLVLTVAPLTVFFSYSFGCFATIVEFGPRLAPSSSYRPPSTSPGTLILKS